MVSGNDESARTLAILITTLRAISPIAKLAGSSCIQSNQSTLANTAHELESIRKLGESFSV
jgi:hypothetical protein